MIRFNDVCRVTSDTLSANYGPDKRRPLVVTLHANGQGDFILMRPLGTQRTIRIKALDVYRIALFHTSGQFAARVRQLRKEGHSLASARRQAGRALFETPKRRKRSRAPKAPAEPIQAAPAVAVTRCECSALPCICRPSTWEGGAQ